MSDGIVLVRMTVGAVLGTLLGVVILGVALNITGALSTATLEVINTAMLIGLIVIHVWIWLRMARLRRDIDYLKRTGRWP